VWRAPFYISAPWRPVFWAQPSEIVNGRTTMSRLNTAPSLIPEFSSHCSNNARWSAIGKQHSPPPRFSSLAEATCSEKLPGARRYHVLFLQDGHTRGTVKYANDVLDLLGPDVIGTSVRIRRAPLGS